MSAGGARWPRGMALAVARELCERMAPACERLVVAGSLRRKAQRVGDNKWNPYGAGFTAIPDGAIVPMESEAAVFAFVGLPYREPWQR